MTWLTLRELPISRDYDYDKAVSPVGEMKAQPLIKNPFRELFFLTGIARPEIK